MKEKVALLFRLLPPQDVGEPESFMAAVMTIFLDFPEEMIDKAVHTIAQRSDRPTLKLIREVCEEIYAPIGRALARERVRQEHNAGLIERPKRTFEEQLRIDRQVNDARWALKSRPRSGLMARIPPLGQWVR